MKKLAMFVGAAMLVMALAVTSASAAKKTYEVCKHGCKYSKIQKAIDAVKHGSKSIVAIDPGTYSEGVIVDGHKYDGLTIKGTGKKPNQVILDGKHAVISGPGGSGKAQNGVEGENVNKLKVLNLWVRNFEANGVFIHADPSKGNETCHGFTMKNDWASFNKSYGLFAKHCIGGSITHGKEWGHGDSGIYIGETPPQGNPVKAGAKPKWTDISHNVMFKNVLGYSGTNSKYVDIHDNVAYNNGAGIVPNTLDGEEFEPASNGKIHNNLIFWNNFDYYKPKSPVKTVGPDGDGDVHYPTGIGVVLDGTTAWKVYDNQIFGNFFWGVAALSDVTNSGGDAINQYNQVYDNKMSRGGTDKNRYDFYNDGSGSHNCFQNNTTNTQDVQAGASQTQPQLYWSVCPNPVGSPASGTGTSAGAGTQFAELFNYVTVFPGCKQEESWDAHSHPKFKNYKEYLVPGGCS
jgi:hypothetical protein